MSSTGMSLLYRLIPNSEVNGPSQSCSSRTGCLTDHQNQIIRNGSLARRAWIPEAVGAEGGIGREIPFGLSLVERSRVSPLDLEVLMHV